MPQPTELYTAASDGKLEEVKNLLGNGKVARIGPKIPA
jgi:hypothetical protein